VFKPDFTLEYAQSAADILFLERASIVNVVGGLVAGAGRVGGQVGASNDRWFAAALLTGGQTGPGAQGDQRAVLGRVAGLIIKTDDIALHLGASGAWLYHVASNEDSQHNLTFSDQPELQVTNVDPSLSTGSIAAHGARMGGLEAGLGWGRLWLQSEWYGIAADAGRPDNDPFFSGWYAQAAYTLVGTPRHWKSKTASWGSPLPAESYDPSTGSWGAVEVGGRFSTIDLNDTPVRGGRQNVWTVGMSWYPTEPLRFIMEYQWAEIEGGSAPRRLNAVAVRGQLRF
jgi:phosphate-selective porin OprO/OprP